LRRDAKSHCQKDEPPIARSRTLHDVKADRTLAQLAEQFDVHPNQITAWKAQLENSAAGVFGPGIGNVAVQPAVDVKSLHAKIGKLTLENDFLEGALTNGFTELERCESDLIEVYRA
jgi:transposase